MLSIKRIFAFYQRYFCVRSNVNMITIKYILSQEKPNQIPKIKLSEERIRSVLPKNVENANIEDFVVKAIEYYSKHLRQKEMGAR